MKRICNELWAVIRAWLAGEGDLVGLLVAWYQVVTGQVQEA